MKKNLLFISLVSLFGFTLLFSTAYSRSGEKRVFAKRGSLPLHESPETDSKKTATAEWNEELEVLETKGRWLKVSGHDGEGWVYSGNVSQQEIPKENRNNIGIQAEGATATAAGRGLTGKAEEYAESHNLNEVAEQIRWAETFNSKITTSDAKDYLKSHNLGEYAGGKQ